MVELPDGTRLLHAIKPGEKLPMQFGREVRLKCAWVFRWWEKVGKSVEERCWGYNDMAISVG
jgi:hypothetical protein